MPEGYGSSKAEVLFLKSNMGIRAIVQFSNITGGVQGGRH
jgi:hypothetical protein